MSSLNRFGDPRSALRPLAATLLLVLAAPVGAETESITGPIGSDTAHTFAHAAVPGAVAMNFHFAGGFAPMFPDTETHTVVVVFEWGPTPAGPWTASPDHVKSVPGGTHWGGGVTISTRDQARIGQLLLDGGAHQGRQLVPREWVERMRSPCAVAPFYGWLTWLNRDGRLFADASRASWFMFGAGGHQVWIDPDHEAVVVTRWMDGAHAAGFVRLVAKAVL